MNNIEETYVDHIELLEKIRDSINVTSDLINELGDLPPTGIENIDNMYLGLHQRQSKVIEMYLPLGEESTE